MVRNDRQVSVFRLYKILLLFRFVPKPSSQGLRRQYCLGSSEKMVVCEASSKVGDSCQYRLILGFGLVRLFKEGSWVVIVDHVRRNLLGFSGSRSA